MLIDISSPEHFAPFPQNNSLKEKEIKLKN